MKKEFSNLIIDIQKKSKIEVVKVRDLKYLQEEIYTLTNKNISYNTLRRFYGFLNPTNPSIDTLNTFALYLGFTNYSSYLNSVVKHDEWFFQMNMLRLQLNLNGLVKNDVIQINTSLQNENNSIAAANYVCFLIEKNKIESLILFFTFFDYKKLTNNSLTKFALLTAFSFYKIENKDALAIYKRLIPFESFRNAGPLYFIDYSHLNGYYGEVIRMINAFNANESDFLFSSLMEFYQKFYSNEDYNGVLINLPKKSEQLYPVLLGRYYGYKILSAEKIDKSLENSIKNELKSAQHQLFLLEIIPALVLRDATDLLDLIFENYYEELFEVDGWSSKTSVAIYLIGLASLNINKENFKTAQNNLSLVELDKIELAYTDYITLFYFLTKIKLYFYEKDFHKVYDNYSKLKELANKIGFHKFITVAQKYIE